MTTTDLDGDEIAIAVVEEASKYWWVFLVTGTLWSLFGFFVLSMRDNMTTAWAVAFVAGLIFSVIAIGELVVMFLAPGWKWLHALLAAIAIIAAICAFAWPGATFLSLAILFAWFLFLHGAIEFGVSLAVRHERDLWWMNLIVGLLEMGIGLWAIGYSGRSLVLLILWIGLASLFKGIGHIITAFALHSGRRHAPA